MYSVQSIVYSVQCTVHSVQCTEYLYRGWFDYLPSPTYVGQFAGASCSHRRGELWGHFIGPHLILVSPGSELSTKETSYWTSIRVSPRSQLSALSSGDTLLDLNISVSWLSQYLKTPEKNGLALPKASCVSMK